ncbi:hypothetical protein BC628DRAFT_565784 [Trametes gibbosa]|nr:hypothetical protein BC628DRAFT_565784 [Trametes gibbosa]
MRRSRMCIELTLLQTPREAVYANVLVNKLADSRRMRNVYSAGTGCWQMPFIDELTPLSSATTTQSPATTLMRVSTVYASPSITIYHSRAVLPKVGTRWPSPRPRALGCLQLCWVGLRAAVVALDPIPAPVAEAYISLRSVVRHEPLPLICSTFSPPIIV